jgi:hypothetical protein
MNMHKIKLTRGARKMMRIEYIRRIKNECNNYNPDDYMLLHLTIKVKGLLFSLPNQYLKQSENIKTLLISHLTDPKMEI